MKDQLQRRLLPGLVLCSWVWSRPRPGSLAISSAGLDAIDPVHAYMALFRAVENGVSVVRHADNGLSVVTDPYGAVLAQMDHFNSGERVMVAQVPTRGVSTLYSAIGDLFAWIAVVGLVALSAWAFVRGHRQG